MACGLTAGRRGEQKPGISKYPQLRWVRSDGWIFRAVIRQSRRLRICGGSEVVTKFFRRRRKVVTPVADKRIHRLIQKWLKAGISEDGEWSETKVGTPQGAVVSPLLANVYLHYAFDL